MHCIHSCINSHTHMHGPHAFIFVLPHCLLHGVLYLASIATAATHMKPRLLDILNWIAPYVTDKWEKIFVQLLGDEQCHVMATIRRDYHRSEEACQVMFEQWLELCPNPSWNDLISALHANSVRKIALAEQLVEHLGMYMVAYKCIHVCMHMFCVRMYMLYGVKGPRGKVFEIICHLSISQIKYQGYSELVLCVYTIIQLWNQFSRQQKVNTCENSKNCFLEKLLLCIDMQCSTACICTYCYHIYT